MIILSVLSAAAGLTLLVYAAMTIEPENRTFTLGIGLAGFMLFVWGVYRF